MPSFGWWCPWWTIRNTIFFTELLVLSSSESLDVLGRVPWINTLVDLSLTLMKFTQDSYRLLMYQTRTGIFPFAFLSANHRVILLLLLQLNDWHANPLLQRLMATWKVIKQALVAKQKLITQFPFWSSEFWHWKEKETLISETRIFQMELIQFLGFLFLVSPLKNQTKSNQEPVCSIIL